LQAICGKLPLVLTLFRLLTLIMVDIDMNQQFCAGKSLTLYPDRTTESHEITKYTHTIRLKLPGRIGATVKVCRQIFS